MRTDALWLEIVTGLSERFLYRHVPFNPVEFSVAAYQFRHSQVGSTYRANFDGSLDGRPFSILIFGPTFLTLPQ